MHVVAIIVYSKIHVSKNSHYRETSQEFGVLRITIFKRTIKKLHLMAVLFVIFLLYITRYIITIHSYTDPYLWLARCSENVLGTILPSVQLQINGFDYSVFGIGFAVDILTL